MQDEVATGLDFRADLPHIKSMLFQSDPVKNRPKVLIVLHQEHSSPGRVGLELVKRGFALDIRKPRFGDLLPDTMENHAGAVIFGGPMSANDPDAFIQKEIDWIGVPLAEEKPFLGICLGAQMMVKHMGGTVTGHHESLVEIGYYPLQPTDAGKSLMDWPKKVYQWHREGFDLPRGADLLAPRPFCRTVRLRSRCSEMARPFSGPLDRHGHRPGLPRHVEGSGITAFQTRYPGRTLL